MDGSVNGAICLESADMHWSEYAIAIFLACHNRMSANQYQITSGKL